MKRPMLTALVGFILAAALDPAAESVTCEFSASQYVDTHVNVYLR